MWWHPAGNRHCCINSGPPLCESLWHVTSLSPGNCDDVPTQCDCNEGYSGRVIAISVPPYYDSTCTAIPCMLVYSDTYLFATVNESLTAFTISTNNDALMYPKSTPLSPYTGTACSLMIGTPLSPYIGTALLLMLGTPLSPYIGTACSLMLGTPLSPYIGTACSLMIGTPLSPYIGTACSLLYLYSVWGGWGGWGGLGWFC